MKSPFYFDNKYLVLIIGLWIGVFYLLGIHWLLIVLISVSLELLFFCRKKPNLNINYDKDNGIIFSPIDGVIKHIEIQNQYQIIHIKRNLFKEWGVYMPTCGKIEEINDLAGKKNWGLSKLNDYSQYSRMNIVINSKFGNYDMSILDSPFSALDCLVESGDYGFSAARLGVIQGAIDVLMFLPKDFSVVMEANEVVKSGNSIIAVNTTVKDFMES